MSLLLGSLDPATIAVSMAIDRPQAIGDAPAGPERSGGWRRRDFLASRGMGEAQGKKVAPPPLRQDDRGAAVQWPDRAIDETASVAGQTAFQEKTWRTWGHARAASLGEGAQTLAYEKGVLTLPSGVRSATQPPTPSADEIGAV
jgi:hypothetical protein